MDMPPIQFARAEDGETLRFFTLGSGPPIVYLGVTVRPRYLEDMWGTNEAALVALSVHATVISVHIDPTRSADADVIAVADPLNLDRFALMTPQQGGGECDRHRPPSVRARLRAPPVVPAPPE
ncbi:MAG TPA: hypothetical protein QF624_00795 [Dehalococcoidia bacterium]|nr:hypothetical protein [Dehalococcoidia bacterium]